MNWVSGGKASYAPGTSGMVGVTVTPGPTKLTLSSASTKLKAGQTLSCTVNVDEGPLPVTGLDRQLRNRTAGRKRQKAAIRLCKTPIRK